jgi:hypothetical protein
VTATREEIGARVDALAQANEGDDFVTAIERLSEELGPDERPLLQEILLERAAVVLDELSRYRDRRVRAWVPSAAADVLSDGATRLIRSLARDRDAEVRDAAVSALIGLGPAAVQAILPDLRGRLHSKEPAERIAAMQKLAAAGDESVLALLEKRAATAALAEERDAARAATIALGAGDARRYDIP